LFSKKRLVELYKANRYDVRQTLPTIKTMLMPISQADRHCEKKLIFRMNSARQLEIFEQQRFNF